MRLRICALGVLLACGGPAIDVDGGLDASQDVGVEHKVGVKPPDAGGDAPAEAALDAPDDVVEELGVDSNPDAPVVDASDGGTVVKGGDICPGVGLCKGYCSCDAGYMYQWHVTPPDGGIDYLCGNGMAPSNPDCPSGWTCSGFKGTTFVSETCP